MENSSLTVPILDAFSNLNLNPELMAEVKPWYCFLGCILFSVESKFYAPYRLIYVSHL